MEPPRFSHRGGHLPPQVSRNRQGNGKIRVRRGHRNRWPRFPALATASRAESTRFTCPMPTPTEAPPAASRIALDLTAAAMPATRNARSARGRGRRAASPALELPGSRGSSPGRVDTVPGLREHPPGDRAGIQSQPIPNECGFLPHRPLPRGAGHSEAAGCSSTSRSGCRLPPGSKSGATTTSAKPVDDLLGHRVGHPRCSPRPPRRRADSGSQARALAWAAAMFVPMGDPARVGVA